MRVDPSGELFIVDDIAYCLAAAVLVLTVTVVLLQVVIDSTTALSKQISPDIGDTQDTIKEKINELNNENPGEYSVYALMDNDGAIRYVGRTKNLSKRLEQHKKSMKTRDLVFAGSIDNLTWCESRGVEEIGIQYYSTLNITRDNNLPQKNYIHGISQYNPNINAYLRAGMDYIYNKISDEIYNIFGN